MKKLALLILILLLNSNLTWGQEKAKTQVIPKIGLNFTDLLLQNNSTNTKPLAKLGWNTGIDIRHGRRLMAEGGFHYFHLGSGIEIKSPAQPVTDNIVSSQFKFPFGVTYMIKEVDYFRFWARGQMVMNLSTQTQQQRGETVTNIYPHSGFSGRIALGIDLSRFVVECSFDRSFTEMLRQTYNAHNQVFALSIGIRLS